MNINGLDCWIMMKKRELLFFQHIHFSPTCRLLPATVSGLFSFKMSNRPKINRNISDIFASIVLTEIENEFGLSVFDLPGNRLS